MVAIHPAGDSRRDYGVGIAGQSHLEESAAHRLDDALGADPRFLRQPKRDR
jgi:hypothetical protein